MATDFVSNAVAAIDWINGDGFDLVIHLGDVTADGIAAPRQVEEAKTVLDRLDVPLLCVPGNHDIGDNPVPGRALGEKPFDAAALGLFRTAFGADHWLYPAGDWALIGLNAQLFNTDSAEETRQFDWLCGALAAVDGPIGLFLHKPWLRVALSDQERHPRYVPLEQRLALAEVLAGHDLRFVASGHTHQLRRLAVDGVEHFWVPSTAFVVPDRMQEWIGEKIVGAAVLTLDGGDYRLDFQRVPGVAHRDLGDYRAIFPKLDAILGE
ncbi:metallophosphoesterase [Sphingomonas sp. MMSM24]|uniref:Metallophosphoesterase n=2 Tax=Sphingomonas lycopersici TaxID=2951807 RepID=A0AA42CQ85_9SPHN|nr:metallophosphoesterase [Sphingomonas lycopersici]